MDRKTLRAKLRVRLDDQDLPYLWSDSELNDYLVRAYDEACVRARLITDSSDASICQITLVSGQRLYEIDDSIIEVNRVHVADDYDPLIKTTISNLDTDFGNWVVDTGKPEFWYLDPLSHDAGIQKIGLYKTPDADNAGRVLTMTVTRYPVDQLDSDTSEPTELNSRYHHDLLDWGEREAFMKHDAETTNPVKAVRAEARFEQRFGPRPTLNILTQRARGVTRRVRASYF